MMMEHVHISRGVTKLGADIPSVSLPVGLTCRADAPCFKQCYARHGRFAFRHNKELLQKNLDVWKNDKEQFERDVLIAAFHSRFFRWHSAGDIPDRSYLDMMVRVAEQLPDVSFLAFTKKFEMVNSYLDEHHTFPQNLHVVLSAWGSFQLQNPFHLPVAYVRLKNQECTIPEDALACSKYCGDCVISGRSCWDLKCGQSVCFNQH